MLVILNFDEKLQVFQFSKFSNFYYIGFSGKAYKFSNASVHLLAEITPIQNITLTSFKIGLPMTLT